MELEHEDLAGRIIGAGIEVHIVRSYLKAVGRNHRLILDFTKPKSDIKRVIAPSDR